MSRTCNSGYTVVLRWYIQHLGFCNKQDNQCLNTKYFAVKLNVDTSKSSGDCNSENMFQMTCVHTIHCLLYSDVDLPSVDLAMYLFVCLLYCIVWQCLNIYFNCQRDGRRDICFVILFNSKVISSMWSVFLSNLGFNLRYRWGQELHRPHLIQV
jgi:hypothetical protein